MSKKVVKPSPDKPQKKLADSASPKKGYIPVSPTMKATVAALVAGGAITAATAVAMLSVPSFQPVAALHTTFWTLLFIVGTLAGCAGITLGTMVARRSERDNLSIYKPLKRKRTYRPRKNTELKEIKDLLTENVEAKRPELSIDLMTVTLPPVFREAIIQIQLTNRGNATAYNFHCEHWSYFRSAVDSVPPQIPTPPPMGNPGTAPPIARDTTYTISLTFPDVKAITWEVVQGPTWEMFVLLQIRYTNEAQSASYSFDRCYRYNPALNRLMIASNEFWPEGFENLN